VLQRMLSHRQRRVGRVIQQKQPMSPKVEEALTGEEMEAVIEGDRRWFREHSDRNHRLRFMSEPEMTLVRLKPADHRWYAIIKQVAPGRRLRLGVSLPTFECPDLFSEEQCAAVYAYATATYAELAAQQEKFLQRV